jgi:hypothetical protein
MCPFSIFQFLFFYFIIFFSSFCVALTHDMEDRPAAAISGQVAAGRASPGRARAPGGAGERGAGAHDVGAARALTDNPDQAGASRGELGQGPAVARSDQGWARRARALAS